jgi:hypothetical protein
LRQNSSQLIKSQILKSHKIKSRPHEAQRTKSQEIESPQIKSQRAKSPQIHPLHFPHFHSQEIQHLTQFQSRSWKGVVKITTKGKSEERLAALYLVAATYWLKLYRRNVCILLKGEKLMK